MIFRCFVISGCLKNFLFIVIALFLVACSAGGSGAGSTAGLSWTAPIQKADNSILLLSEITGYRIYYGVEKGVYTGWVEINDSSATQAQISGIPSGKYFVVMTTFDTNGLESKFSIEVEVTI